jgi:hypothetical protein
MGKSLYKIMLSFHNYLLGGSNLVLLNLRIIDESRVNTNNREKVIEVNFKS